MYYTIFGCTRKIKICGEIIHDNELEVSITYSVRFISQRSVELTKVKYNKNLKELDSDLGGFTGNFGGLLINFYITELSENKIQGRYMVFDFLKNMGHLNYNKLILRIFIHIQTDNFIFLLL